MDVLIERSCGLDVHQKTVVATILIGQGRQKKRETRTFGTMTAHLLDLVAWLQTHQITHVGMESTGSYWKPIHKLLKHAFTVIVGNAFHIRNVPGRKTDVKDSEWLATLVRHGLVAPSFVPDEEIQALRDATRLRRKFVQELTSAKNRILVTLEECNIKLASVATDPMGVSGRAMVRALIEGQQTPEEMALLSRGRLKSKIETMALALDGRIAAYQRVLLELQLDRIEYLERQVAKLDALIGTQLEPHAELVALLDTIPGVNRVVAAELLAELGTDMSVFHGLKPLCAWAGVAPGSYESAGKSKSHRTRRGNVHLKTALVQAAMSASRQKGTYLKDKYHRLKSRRGAMKAAVAVGRKILIAAYQILSKRVPYEELGESFLDRLDRNRVIDNLVRRLERLGVTVNIEDPTTVLPST